MWPQLHALGHGPYAVAVISLAAAVGIVGGILMQWRATAQVGAIALGAVYLISALLYVPRIIQAPLIYDRWGNFFEQFSMFSGALIVYADLASHAWRWAGQAARIGRISFAVCVVSFALEQTFYLNATAGFVPKWIPLGQMFWAVATTIAFVLAAIAIATGVQLSLGARLLTAMLVLFGILVWIPMLFAHPGSHFNWSETAETFAIAGVAWMLADSARERAARRSFQAMPR